jgi:DNA-binding GntR family transcriptional regulator
LEIKGGFYYFDNNHDDGECNVKSTLITVESLNQKAYELIKEAIIQNELLPGSRIVDSQIAEKFGISRTPVRDAIQMLMREGLIENKGKKGYYVFNASAKDINEIYDIRLIIDKEAINKIITVLLPDNAEYYKTEIDKIYSSIGKKDKITGIDFIKDDEIFHDKVISLAGNARLLKIYGDIRNQTRVFRQITSYNEQRVKRAINSHREMVSAMKEGNLDLALKVAIEHVELSKEDALKDILNNTSIND